MYINCVKWNIVTCVIILEFLVSSCSKKVNVENHIIITVKSVDQFTKQPRVNAFDTIEVRKGEFGYLMRKYVKTGELITDSLGEVKINLDRSERYRFTLYGNHVFSSAEFAEDKLKNGQEVIIEVVPPEKREIPW